MVRRRPWWCSIFVGLVIISRTAAEEHEVSDSTRDASPIRRVISMLQSMDQKVTLEGERMKELFDKAICYCKDQGVELTANIKAANIKIPQLEASIREMQAEDDQLVKELQLARSDKAQYETTLKEMKSMRDKEKATFETESAEYDANLKAVGLAIATLKKGMAGGFLQATDATRKPLERILHSISMSIADSDKITAFLSQDQSEGYAPESGEVVGMLSQLQDSMRASLQELISDEDAARVQYAVMSKAKSDQVAALAKMIGEKEARRAELSTALASARSDLEDTKRGEAGTSKFLADLEKSCKEKRDMWQQQTATRANEKLAISEAIKVLNDDEALHLFRKTFPVKQSDSDGDSDSPVSFLQVSSPDSRQKQAIQALRKAQKKAGHNSHLDLLTAAMSAKKPSFAKLIKLCDDMIRLLSKETKDDDDKRAYCTKQIERSDDELKVMENDISDFKKSFEDAESQLKTLVGEIQTLVEGIQDLDKKVEELTAIRKKEHQEYLAEKVDNRNAKDIIHVAKNILNRFYNPEAEKVALAQKKTTPLDDFTTASKDNGKDRPDVFGLIEQLIADLDKEYSEMELEERNSQDEYERVLAHAAEQRETSARNVADKETNKAIMEQKMRRLEKQTHAKKADAEAMKKYLKEIHAECDWLLANYKIRRDARAAEVDALNQAKAVLSQSDFKPA